MCSGAGLCLHEEAEEGQTAACYKQLPGDGDAGREDGEGGHRCGHMVFEWVPFYF